MRIGRSDCEAIHTNTHGGTHTHFARSRTTKTHNIMMDWPLIVLGQIIGNTFRRFKLDHRRIMCAPIIFNIDRKKATTYYWDPSHRLNFLVLKWSSKDLCRSLKFFAQFACCNSFSSTTFVLAVVVVYFFTFRFLFISFPVFFLASLSLSLYPVHQLYVIVLCMLCTVFVEIFFPFLLPCSILLSIITTFNSFWIPSQATNWSYRQNTFCILLALLLVFVSTNCIV